MNDDELLARLRAADPAATASAPELGINRLVEAAMTTDRTTRTSAADSQAPAPRPQRSRRFALAAAAATVVLVGGGITWKAVAGHDSNGDQTSAKTPLALSLANGVDAKCMEPTAELLRNFDIAFEGSITSQEDDQVVFRIEHWFKGGEADTARLTNDGADGGSETLTFVVGERYLVTAQDGVVPVCGGTNLASPEGEALFYKAFGK